MIHFICDLPTNVVYRDLLITVICVLAVFVGVRLAAFWIYIDGVEETIDWCLTTEERLYRLRNKKDDENGDTCSQVFAVVRRCP